ncbi:MAG: ArsR/SmtB family transcription factor [Actinomycetota bacterium]
MRSVRELRSATARPAAECCAPLAATEMTPDEAEATSTLFKALGDPHRVLIMNVLANSDAPVCVCDITPELGLAQPTVSFHLKKLVAAGLLQREQRGVWAYYSVNRASLERLASVFQQEEGSG